MEVERVVERLAALVAGDAVGGRVGERVRAADDEALEGEARVEGRAARARPHRRACSGRSLAGSWMSLGREQAAPGAARGRAPARRSRRGPRPARTGVPRTPMLIRSTVGASAR